MQNHTYSARCIALHICLLSKEVKIQHLRVLRTSYPEAVATSRLPGSCKMNVEAVISQDGQSPNCKRDAPKGLKWDIVFFNRIMHLYIHYIYYIYIYLYEVTYARHDICLRIYHSICIYIYMHSTYIYICTFMGARCTFLAPPPPHGMVPSPIPSPVPRSTSSNTSSTTSTSNYYVVLLLRSTT